MEHRQESEERKVALIPRVIVQGVWGPRDYGVLLTDRRAIFVLETSSAATTGAILGGAIGAAIAQAVAEKKVVDYGGTPPGLLAFQKGSLVVSYESIRSLRLKKGLSGYSIRVEHMTAEGKKKTVQGVIMPPPSFLQERKKAGIKTKEAMAQYAGQVQTALRKALPQGVAARAVWLP